MADYNNPDYQKGRRIMAALIVSTILVILGIIGGLMQLVEVIARVG